MRLVKIILITVAAAILLAAGGGALLLATSNEDDYRRLAAYLFERATGRTMVVDGRFAIHPSLRPSLVMSRVRIANPPWASEPDFADIGHLEIQIALRPLLSGALAIERLILNDATFALERNAEGEANWTFGSREGLGLVPVFGTVRLRNVEGRYRDDGSGRATAVRLAHLTMEEAGAAARLEAEGTWDGEAVTAKGTLGTLAEALNPSSPFPIDLAVAMPGLDLGLTGSIADPVAGRGLDLGLQGRSDDLGRFLALLDSKAPLAGPIDARATLRGDFDAVQVSDLRLSAGRPPTLDVRGAIATVRSGGAPFLDGIDLRIEGATATAALSTWLGHRLPDLGPVAGQLTLGGTSEALAVRGLELHAGTADGPTIGASGDIAQIQLGPAFSVRGADLKLTAAAPDLAALGTAVDLSLPARSFSYDGRLSGHWDNWTLAGEAQLGDTAIRQTFTGAIADPPRGLSGELSVALAGLEVSARGTVAAPAEGQGLDLHVAGQAPDVAPVLALLGWQVPSGQLAGEVTIQGDLEALQLSDLRVSLDQGPRHGGRPVQATGRIAKVAPSGATLLEGIDLEVRGATSTAALSGWLGRSLPDLGPIEGQLALSGSSKALKVTGIELQAGTADRLTLATAGAIAEVRPERDPALRGVDLEIDAKAPDLSSIGALIGVSLPATRLSSYKGRVTGDAAKWKLAGKLRVGRTVIDQDLAGSQAGERPRLSGELSIPTLYLGDFGVGAGAAAPGTSIEPWPSPARVLGALDAVDLALSVDIGQVEGTRLAIGRARIDLTLEDGVLQIDPARFDFVAGTMLVHATANSRAKPPEIDLSLDADDVQLGEFLQAMGRSGPFTGELALILKLRTQGDAPAQLLSSLGGDAQFALQRGSVDLGSLNLATADVLTWMVAGAERGTGLLRGITTSGRTSLECFAGHFAIADGIATAQSMLMKTPLTISTAQGTVDLVDREIDLNVHLRARRDRLFHPAATYRIRGPLADPQVEFSKTGFAVRALEGLVLTPVDVLGSLLRPLVSDGGRDPANPCLTTES